MAKLPLGVNINNLIEDLKNYSWEAADILINYSEKIKDIKVKNEVLKYDSSAWLPILPFYLPLIFEPLGDEPACRKL